MITINGIVIPTFVMSENEMTRSLGINANYFKLLEAVGLPYIQVEETRLYNPNGVWKWWNEYRRTG